jgi:hypothetical protein
MRAIPAGSFRAHRQRPARPGLLPATSQERGQNPVRKAADRRPASLRDGGEVGTMGLGDICQDLGVGRKPHLLAAGAADRPPSRPERGRRDLIGGSAVRAGDQHRLFVPAKGTLLHASRPFVNGPETKGKPKALGSRLRGKWGRRKAALAPKRSSTPTRWALLYKVDSGADGLCVFAAALRRDTWFGLRTLVCAMGWGLRFCVTSVSVLSRIHSSF